MASLIKFQILFDSLDFRVQHLFINETIKSAGTDLFKRALLCYFMHHDKDATHVITTKKKQYQT